MRGAFPWPLRDHYLAGEREAAWAEPTALVPANRDEPLAADARIVFDGRYDPRRSQ